ncbi:MAG: hypothetical protein KAU21_09855 [Gammaproteobacteria bacterium]|nr:hypothetical protein [Gammaproteobacteria bacterium]
MNLDDLFNRLSRKQKNEYDAFRTSLKNSPTRSQAETEALLKNIQHRAQVFSLFIVTSAVIIIFFIPKLKGIVIVFAILILLWIFTTSLKGKSFVKRYLKEEYPNDSSTMD